MQFWQICFISNHTLYFKCIQYMLLHTMVVNFEIQYFCHNTANSTITGIQLCIAWQCQIRTNALGNLYILASLQNCQHLVLDLFLLIIKCFFCIGFIEKYEKPKDIIRHYIIFSSRNDYHLILFQLYTDPSIDQCKRC